MVNTCKEIILRGLFNQKMLINLTTIHRIVYFVLPLDICFNLYSSNLQFRLYFVINYIFDNFFIDYDYSILNNDRNNYVTS